MHVCSEIFLINALPFLSVLSLENAFNIYTRSWQVDQMSHMQQRQCRVRGLGPLHFEMNELCATAIVFRFKPKTPNPATVFEASLRTRCRPSAVILLWHWWLKILVFGCIWTLPIKEDAFVLPTTAKYAASVSVPTELRHDMERSVFLLRLYR